MAYVSQRVKNIESKKQISAPENANKNKPYVSERIQKIQARIQGDTAQEEVVQTEPVQIKPVQPSRKLTTQEKRLNDGGAPSHTYDQKDVVDKAKQDQKNVQELLFEKGLKKLDDKYAGMNVLAKANSPEYQADLKGLAQSSGYDTTPVEHNKMYNPESTKMPQNAFAKTNKTEEAEKSTISEKFKAFGKLLKDVSKGDVDVSKSVSELPSLRNTINTPYLGEKAKMGLMDFGSGLSHLNEIGKMGETQKNLSPTQRMQALQNKDRAEFQRAEDENVSGGLKKAGEVVQATSAMIPNIILSAANPTMGLAQVGLSAAGNSAQQAMKENATKGQALAYGALSGGIEAGTEKLFGGLPFMKGVGDKVAGKLINPIKNKVIKAGVRWTMNMGEEALEEGIAGALDPFAKRLTYDKGAKMATPAELAEQMMMGAAVAGILGIPGTVIDPTGKQTPTIQGVKDVSDNTITFTMADGSTLELNPNEMDKADLQKLDESLRDIEPSKPVQKVKDAIDMNLSETAIDEAELQDAITTPRPQEEIDKTINELREIERAKEARDKAAKVETPAPLQKVLLDQYGEVEVINDEGDIITVKNEYDMEIPMTKKRFDDLKAKGQSPKVTKTELTQDEVDAILNADEARKEEVIAARKSKAESEGVTDAEQVNTPTVNKVAGNGAQTYKSDINKIPEYVQRIEEPNITRATVDKPHGVYTSPANVESPHKGLGGDTFYWKTNPDANVLKIQVDTFKTNRGLVGESAGVGAARKLLGDDEVSRMIKLSKRELVQDLSAKYPSVEWSKYYDQQEMVEGIAGLEARKAGYDAIWAVDPTMPEMDEFVGLTDNALSKVDNIPSTKNVAQNGVQDVAKPVSTIKMDERTPINVGTTKVKAYMFENPEVKPLYQGVAKYILEYEYVPNEQYERITPVMKQLKADTGLTPVQVKDALERLVTNHGQENAAAAKRVELVIDDMLMHGFDMFDGVYIDPNEEYLKLKGVIEGREFKLSEKVDSDEFYDAFDKQDKRYATEYEPNVPEETGKIKDTDQIGIEGTNIRTVKGKDGNAEKLMSPYGQAWKNKDGTWGVQKTGQSSKVNVATETDARKAIDSGMERTEVKVKKGAGVGEQQTMDVPEQFKGAEPGDIDYKPIKVGMQTQIVNADANGKTLPFRFEDSNLESIHQANKGIKGETPLQKFVGFWTELKNKFTRPISTLPVKGYESIYYGKNGIINLRNAKGLAGDETQRIIKDITKVFRGDKNAYDIFSRKVLLDDLAEEVRMGGALPNGWTPETIESELRRINQVMPESVTKALEKRKQYWDGIKEKYIKAKGDVGVNYKNRFERENYFRHQVLEHMEIKNAIAGTGKKLKTATNRGFAKARSGEYTGNINTDYLQAEYEVMAQMLHDTKVDNTLKHIMDKADISEKVLADAEAQGLENWKEAIPEGYTVFQPREGNMFYSYKPLAEEVVEEALSLRRMTLNDITDPKIRVVLEDIMNDLEKTNKEVLAVGGRYREYVIPQELSDTLDNMQKNKATSRPAKFFQTIHSAWKRWILYVNPRKAVKYWVRNIGGDLDATVAGNPVGLKKTMQSMVELGEAMRNGKFTPELKSYYDMGGYQATQAAQEIQKVNKLKGFEDLYDQTIGEKITSLPGKYVEAMSNLNDYREMILRYGTYLDYFDQLKKGTLKNYGASKKSIIDALDTNEEKAYKLANDLLGAYDDVSEAGQFIRRQIIPFYSWLETNFKRYNQLFKNAVTTGDMGTAAKTATGVAVKAGLSATSKMARIFLVTIALAAWNKLKYKDLEETLPEDVKSKPHLILGKNTKTGETIYFSRLGSLNDYLEWFGLDTASQDVTDILDGKKTIMEQLQDMAKSPTNKLATAVRPAMKLPAELLSGKKFYPDVFKAGNIRDSAQYLAQQLGVGDEYNLIAGKPSKSYFKTWADIFAYTSQPEEAAYWNMLDVKSKWQKRKSGSYGNPDDKSMALYNYKLALRYDDKEAQEKYIKLYESYGGNTAQTISSVLTMSPYYGIAKADRSAYKSSLTEKQKKSLELAEQYFIDLLETELTNKRPLTSGTKAMLNIYKKTGETTQFPKVVSNEMTVRGKKVKLSQKEVAEYQGRVNKAMYKRTDELANHEDFKNKTLEQQAELLSKALNNVVATERLKWKHEKYKD